MSSRPAHARLLALARSGEDVGDFAIALLAAGSLRTGSGLVSVELFEALAGLRRGTVDADIRCNGASGERRWPKTRWIKRWGQTGRWITPSALAAWLADQSLHRHHAPGTRQALDRIAA